MFSLMGTGPDEETSRGTYLKRVKKVIFCGWKDRMKKKTTKGKKTVQLWVSELFLVSRVVVLSLDCGFCFLFPFLT